MEDSRPQAILKFHRLSSLDYRVRHKLPVKATLDLYMNLLTLNPNPFPSPYTGIIITAAAP